MNFYHEGSLSDIIYSLPTVIALGSGNFYFCKKIVEIYKSLKELLLLQHYIHHVTIWDEDIEIDYSLDKYKDAHLINYRKSLAECYLEAFGVNYDLTKPWLRHIKPKKMVDIVINRAYRDHDQQEINWKILKDYEDRSTFIGTERDYEKFLVISNLANIKRYYCRDSLEYAQIIRGSRLFIGNQSLGFALAEAMKHPRVLERYYIQDNYHPQTNNGYTYLSKNLIEDHLHKTRSVFYISFKIPDAEIQNSKLLKIFYNSSEKPVVFLPYYGEFGPVIDKLVKLVHFYDAPYKIVCCKQGDEAYFPDADKFYYDWNDFVPDEKRWGFSFKREHKDLKQQLVKDYESIKQKLGSQYDYIDLARHNDDPIFNKYNHLFRFDLKPKTTQNINVDIVISPRNRKQRTENNFLYWKDIINRLNKEGFTVGCIGHKNYSIKLENSAINSWDFNDNASAIIELLQNCKLYLGLDTGTTYIAALLSVPIIMFSHANQQWYFSNFIRELTTNYFLDLGKEVYDYNIVIDKTLEFLKNKNHAILT